MSDDTEVDDLFRRYRETGDRRLRNQLVERHQGLAISIAKRYANRGESLDDLRQVALLGLVKSVERYDPERPVRFSSFAAPTIAGEVKRHFRDSTWRIRVSRRDQELSRRARERSASLAQQLGRAPKLGELAADLDVDTEDLLGAMEAAEAYRPGSLDTPAGEGEATVGERVGERDDRLDTAADRLALTDLIADLPEREQTVIRLRFEDELTQSEIAEQVGISQMHVSRVLRRTLRLLRSRLDLPDEERR